MILFNGYLVVIELMIHEELKLENLRTSKRVGSKMLVV